MGDQQQLQTSYHQAIRKKRPRREYWCNNDTYPTASYVQPNQSKSHREQPQPESLQTHRPETDSRITHHSVADTDATVSILPCDDRVRLSTIWARYLSQQELYFVSMKSHQSSRSSWKWTRRKLRNTSSLSLFGNFKGFLRILLFQLILLPMMIASAARYDYCSEKLQQAAGMDDNPTQLSTNELDQLVTYLSGGVVTTVSESSATLQSTHTTLFENVVSSTPELVELFCNDLIQEIITVQTELDVSETKCFFALQIGDANRDGFLQEQIEFPRYANQLSGNLFGFTVAYSDLNPLVQDVFTNFQTDDLISIQGARSSDDITEEQRLALTTLCQHTAIAILASRLEETAPASAPTTTTEAPGTDTDNGDAGASTFTFAICTRMMAFADTTRDNSLNQEEYFDWCNRLISSVGTGSAYTGTYTDLPMVLQTNFDSLAALDGGQINVFGAKPGQTPSTDDTSRLTQICTATDEALQKAASEAPSLPTDATNAPDSNNSSAIPFDKCKLDMIFSDLSRDNFLSDTEFVRFVSRNSDSVTMTDNFASLPSVVQDVFASLKGDGEFIDVTGSKPNQTPTASQQSHLERICAEVGAAVSGDDSSVAGTVVVYNSFVISNTVRRRAAGIDAVDRDALSEAYKQFVSEALGVGPLERFLLRRRLPPSSVQSVEIYVLHDSNCPSYVTGGNKYCQTVFGKFTADFVNETNERVALETFTEKTQDAIVPLLQNKLRAVRASTIINVEGSSKPLQPSDDEKDPAFVLPDDDSGQSSTSSGGLNIGQVIAALVMALLVICGGTFVYLKVTGKKLRTPGWAKDGMVNIRGNLSKLPGVGSMMNKMDGANTEKVEENSDHDSPYGMESALHRDYENGHTFNVTGGDIEDDDEDEEEGSGEDDDEDSAEFSIEVEQSGEQKKKKRFRGKKFRMGKSKSGNKDNDINMLETGDDFADGDDFVNYSFEEPPEVKTKQDGDSSFHEWGDGNIWGVSADTTTTQEKHETVASPQFRIDEDDDDDDADSFSGSDSSRSESGGGSKASVVSGVENTGHLGGLVDNGKWDGVMETAKILESNLDPSISSNHSEDKSRSESHSESFSSYANGDADLDDMLNHSFAEESEGVTERIEITEEEHQRRAKYHEQVLDLVKKAAPDEIDNVSTMMENFSGREAELISTLQTMYARTNSQRRMKAVHRSKAIINRSNSGLATGGAEGSAVIAAASMMYGEEEYSVNDEGSFTGSQSHTGSYTGSRSGSGSYSQEGSYGRADDDQGSYTGSRSGSRSYYSDEGSYTGSYSNQEGSYTGSRSGSRSYNSAEGSYTGTYSDHEGSQRGSQAETYDDEGSHTGRSGSYNSQEGSYTENRLEDTTCTSRSEFYYDDA